MFLISIELQIDDKTTSMSSDNNKHAISSRCGIKLFVEEIHGKAPEKPMTSNFQCYYQFLSVKEIFLVNKIFAR